MCISEYTECGSEPTRVPKQHRESCRMWLPSRSRRLKHLGSDEGGAVLIWVSAMIFVIFAFVGLAIDGARYLNLNSNLQEIADAAALAGAKELNGAADAIERARTRRR